MPDTIVTPIDARPTKELFIEMLTRDVPLLWAILDVVDNSVDAARKQSRDGNLAAFSIDISLGDSFRIADNCGGMTRDEAQRYAFRFGRDSANPPSPHSVGQFGVGMKRTLFKLGTLFQVVSKCGREQFKVCVDVDEWKRQDGNWHFDMTDAPGDMLPDQDGLVITVDRLHPAIRETLAQDTFVYDLREEIQRAHFKSLAKGLRICINGLILDVPSLTLKSSALLIPFYEKYTFRSPLGETVSAEIHCGLAERSLVDGGWYIFCNDRMVLCADQTAVTGWGEGRGRAIPKYHADFAYFRGYVFFSAENPKLLPWNSMKTGLDTDSEVYKFCKQKMLGIMRRVINTLRQLAEERSLRSKASLDKGRLEAAVDDSPATDIISIVDTRDFIAPAPEVEDLRDDVNVVNILYQRDMDLVEKAKRLLGVTSGRAVGEATFDYFMRNEG